jgi:hypothetical protein
MKNVWMANPWASAAARSTKSGYAAGTLFYPGLVSKNIQIKKTTYPIEYKRYYLQLKGFHRLKELFQNRIFSSNTRLGIVRRRSQ